MHKIEMYTTKTCPWCVRATNLLHSRGVDAINYIDVSDDREPMIQRTGRMTVPQIYIGDRHVGGFDDLAALDRAGELEPLLRDVGAVAPPVG